MRRTYYAIGLNFHQPYGNLAEIHDASPWEANQILRAYERALRYFGKLRPEARLHISFSGSLLMQLLDLAVQNLFKDVMDVHSLIQNYAGAEIEFMGSSCTHAVFPIIPQNDWDTQMGRYLDIARPALGRNWLAGFWPPEMGFCMEMIPHLKKFGYRYVVVDCEHIEPLTPMTWDRIRYRPHWAHHGGADIIIVPRDREISNAQLSGFDPEWFAYEVRERTKYCVDYPPLVTSWSDGENGGWFRNMSEESGFWGWFYEPILQMQRSGGLELRQTSINEYLDQFGADGEVRVRSGAWNTGDHSGYGFVQWTGSLLQKRGLEELRRISSLYHDTRWAVAEKGRGAQAHQILDEALWHIMLAETSCNFYWGSRWVHRAFDELEQAESLISRAA
jgi:alpha-amylase/alpha-mannosidase (GH57 family)